MAASPSLLTSSHPRKGRIQGHVTHFRILHPLKDLRNSNSWRLQILYMSWPHEVLAFWWLTVPQVGVVRIMSLEISVERLKLETSKFVYLLAAWSISFVTLDYHQVDGVMVTWPISTFLGPQAISLERIKLDISNLVCRLNVKSTGIKVLQYGGVFRVTWFFYNLGK